MSTRSALDSRVSMGKTAENGFRTVLAPLHRVGPMTSVATDSHCHESWADVSFPQHSSTCWARMPDVD